MVSKAAPTTFEAGPVDKVKTGDPNKIAANTATNSLPVTTLSSGLKLNTLMKLTGTNTNLGLVKSLSAKLAAGDLNPNKMLGNLKKFGTDVTKNFSKGVENLAGDMLTNALKSTGWVDESMAKNLFGADGKLSIAEAKQMYKGVKMMVDDTETFIKNADFKSVSGISKIISDITGTPGMASVLNISTELATLKFVNDLATEWGVTKLADKLLDTLPDDESKRQFCIELLPSAINAGHLDNINLAINKLGANFILANYPSVVGDILMNYRYPSDQFEAKSSDAVALLATLSRLDPNWCYYNRQGKMIYNLDAFANASRAALDTLALDPKYRIPALMATNHVYKERTVMDIASDYYDAIFTMA